MTKVRSFASFTAARNGMRVKPGGAMISQPDVCAIASISSTPGISGWPGKWPSKIVLVFGNLRVAPDRAVDSRSSSTIRSMS